MEEKSNLGQVFMIFGGVLVGGLVLFSRKKRKHEQAALVEKGRDLEADTLAFRQLRLAEEEIDGEGGLRQRFIKAQRGETKLTRTEFASRLRKIEAHLQRANEADDRWSPQMRERALRLANIARELREEIIAWQAVREVAREKPSGEKREAVDARLMMDAGLFSRSGGADIREIAEAFGVSDDFALKRALMIAKRNAAFAVVELAGRKMLRREA